MSSFGATDPYDEVTVRGMVETIVPDWTVVDIEPCEQGTDAIYFVTVTTPFGTREAVLKASEFVDLERFRREPRLIKLAGDAGLPVPAVYGVLDEHADLPAPCFLMERCAGEALDDGGASALSADALGAVAETAGNTLATVHDLIDLDGFGALALDDEEIVVDDPTDWQTCRREGIEEDLELLSEGRFADLVDDLREYVETELAILDGSFEPSLVHNDYRIGNLLLDPETEETSAVLDWGTAFAAHHEYDLATTESLLVGSVGLDAERRRLVREQLYAGYERVSSLDRDRAFRRRRELYLLDRRLSAMRWFKHWHADATANEKAAIARDHRAFVSEILE